VTGGVHPPEGYPEAQLPSKISNLVQGHSTGKITQVIKYENNTWMIKVNKFDARNRDFAEFIRGGLTGVRVDSDHEILLYFKL
jgi:hypothetical protein